MADVGLVDVSLRDGNQSLWGAAGVRSAHVLQVAPILERVGFHALDYSSSTAMGMLVRTHREDPWALFRRTRALMPRTKLQFIGTGFRFISWQNSHPDTMQLVYDRLAANGIDRVVVLDPMHDMDAARRHGPAPEEGRDRGGGRRADLHHQRRPQRRVLRRHRPSDARLPRHRPCLRQGPRRDPHRRAGPHPVPAVKAELGEPCSSCTPTRRSGSRR